MNSKLFNSLAFLYASVSILEIISEATGSRELHMRSKPLLMLVLLVLFLTATKSIHHPAKVPVVLALAFSWFGDVLLMFKQEYSLAFLLGLGSFLASHIFYIVAYRMGAAGRFQLSFYAFVPVIGYGIVLYSVLAPHLGTMLLPVGMYAIVLLAMFIAALERGERVSKESYWLVVIGAGCFVVSDSLLAWHSFVQPSVWAQVVLMILYISAQFAIVRGMAKHITEKS